jgi:hypothetical protein
MIVSTEELSISYSPFSMCNCCSLLFLFGACVDF